MRLEPDDIRELQPVIREVVRIAIDQYRADDARMGGRLAFSEAEAARLLGVARHVLRDLRLKGKIRARKAGREYRYSKEVLLNFLHEDC